MQKRGGVDPGWYLDIRELTTPSSSSNEEEEEKRSEEGNQSTPTSSGGSTARNSLVAPAAPKGMAATATKREEGVAATAVPPPQPLRSAEGNEARYDPMAWIILQLPSNLRPRGRKLLNESESSINWNVFSGEVSLVGEKNRTLPGSNIVDIVRHALDPGRLEPTGYSQVYPYLPRGSTPPDDDDDDDSTSSDSSTASSSGGGDDTSATSTDGEDVMSTDAADTSSSESDYDDDEWRDIDEVDAKAEKKLMKAANRQ